MINSLPVQPTGSSGLLRPAPSSPPPLGASLDGLPIPPRLRANVERHHANLGALVATLGCAGIDDAMIEMSVTTIIASYQAELLANLKALHRDASDD